jgi:hypothetical protein
MARAADPAGKRKVGIITKCDALQPGDEQGVRVRIRSKISKLTVARFFVLPKTKLKD